MGFIICTLEPLEGARIRLRRLRKLALSGRDGIFAKHVPRLAAPHDGSWSLSAAQLLALAEPDADPRAAIMFDLGPFDPSRYDLYEFVDAVGRSNADSTDVLFQFKIACAGVKRASAPHGLDDLTLPAWPGAAVLYDQLKLEGGLSGGTWQWSKTSQDLAAAVFHPPRKA